MSLSWSGRIKVKRVELRRETGFERFSGDRGARGGLVERRFRHSNAARRRLN